MSNITTSSTSSSSSSSSTPSLKDNEDNQHIRNEIDADIKSIEYTLAQQQYSLMHPELFAPDLDSHSSNEGVIQLEGQLPGDAEGAQQDPDQLRAKLMKHSKKPKPAKLGYICSSS